MIPVISIVVPAYKASNFIKDAIEKKLKVLGSIGVPFELILVVDGKDEASRLEIAPFMNMAQFKVVYLKNNHGKGFAVRRGMQQAKGKFVGYMDVDNDIDPKVIKDMYDEIIGTQLTAILPSKTNISSRINYPVKRKLFSKIYHFIVKTFFHLSCSDTQLGAKLYSKELVKTVLPFCTINGFAFELEMLSYANKLNILRFKEIPVIVNFKTQTTISLKNGIKVLVDTLKLFFRIEKFESHKK